ncbi:hypothetical protein PCE1_003402 [Barthelona sp. PCE]
MQFFLLLLIASPLWLAYAQELAVSEIDFTTCIKMCSRGAESKYVSYSADKALTHCKKQCTYPDFRHDILEIALKECIHDDAQKSEWDCMRDFQHADVASLSRIVRRKKYLAGKHVTLVDDVKRTSQVADVIDIPGLSSGVSEDDMPKKPSKKCSCPEKERVSASAKFGNLGYKDHHKIDGYFCVKTGCFLSKKMKLPKPPVVSNYVFQLEDLNPIDRMHLFKGKTRSITYKGHTKERLYFATEEIRRIHHGEKNLLVMSDGRSVETSEGMLKPYVPLKKLKHCSGPMCLTTRKATPVRLWKAKGGKMADYIRDGDVVCLYNACESCVAKMNKKLWVLERVCTPSHKYRVKVMH